MEKNKKIYNVQTDISSITFDLYGACVCIRSTTEKYLALELSKNALIHIANTQGDLFIKQNKRLLARFRKKPVLTLFVPEHLLPSIQINGNDTLLTLSGGIYRSLELYSVTGEVKLSGAAFETVDIKGDNLNICADNLTVKSGLLCNIQSGETLLENCFATHTECRNKCGNVGVVNLTCKDNLFEAEHGNVTASIVGNKDDYNLTFATREGTCNMESDEGKTCTGALKAFTYKGNIYVDFIKESEEV
jgi:hypothetical protein